MSLKIGIVGLPNVGKSTLFNALTRTKCAAAENYPFCTIDPNVGIVEVPDKRLKILAEISKSKKIVPAAVEFVDIAGLVKGASKGEGLGNKFLAHIRECDAIGHIVRFFSDPNVSHVHGTTDPKSDREIVESELLLADIETMDKSLAKAISDSKAGDKGKKEYAALLQKISDNLKAGNLASNLDLRDEEKKSLKNLHLLSMKPYIYFINVDEKELKNIDIKKYAEILNVNDPNKIIPVSAKVEQDLADFSEEEAAAYLKTIGLEETGLNAVIKAAYATLGLITYLTTGPTETRAWTIRKGTLAPQAAGVIHTDFEKGFVKADVINWQKFVEAGSEVKARELGYIRSEGKEYEVKDGDVVHFKFAT